MATVSALMAGFVNVALVQFDFRTDQIPIAVLFGFGVTNALTTAANVCCMVICTLMLGNTFRAFTVLLSEEDEATFMVQCRAFAKGFKPGDKPPVPFRNFRTHWNHFCRAEWERALCLFTAGLIFFIGNTCFASFIKFNEDYAAAVVLCVGLGPGIVFCMYLHIRWLPYLLSKAAIHPVVMEQKVTPMGLPFDWHLPGMKVQYLGSESCPMAPQLPFTLPSHMKQIPAWWQNYLRKQALWNINYLWKRYEKGMRCEMEERAEELRSFSFLSGIVAGFAVAALLQLQIMVQELPQGFQIWFATSAAVCAACAITSMVMCSLIMMSIVKMSRDLVSGKEETVYVDRCLEFLTSYKFGSRPPAPTRTFKTHWDSRCEGEWRRAFFLFALGLAAFLINCLAGIWIKYRPYISVSIASTACMLFALLYLFQLYCRWTPFIAAHNQPGKKLPRHDFLPMGLPFDWLLPPRQEAGTPKPLNPLEDMAKGLVSLAHKFERVPSSFATSRTQDSSDGKAAIGSGTGDSLSSMEEQP